MKIHVYNKMFFEARSNFWLLIVVFFSLLLGISLGTFNEIQLSYEAKENIQEILDSHLSISGLKDEVMSDLFLKSIATNCGLFLIIVIAGISIIGFPAALLSVAYKGAALGFSSALLMDTLGGKGVFLVAVKLLPANIIIIPALCLAAVHALKFSFELLAGGLFNIKKNLRSSAGPYFIFQSVMGILILGGCFIESFITV